jgi:hypothetical protein
VTRLKLERLVGTPSASRAVNDNTTVVVEFYFQKLQGRPPSAHKSNDVYGLQAHLFPLTAQRGEYLSNTENSTESTVSANECEIL